MRSLGGEKVPYATFASVYVVMYGMLVTHHVNMHTVTHAALHNLSDTYFQVPAPTHTIGAIAIALGRLTTSSGCSARTLRLTATKIIQHNSIANTQQRRLHVYVTSALLRGEANPAA